jgi:divalent metal cation (Fe/Co/Zn/Cd) transporter
VLNGYSRENSLLYHALRTRQSGARRFISVHILVPNEWTIQRAHDLVEHIEDDLRARLPNTSITTHLEPLEDPKSWQDTKLEGERLNAK